MQIKKIFSIFFILISSIFSLFSQTNNIDYYGIVSTQIEENIAKMTSDLFYTQLAELQDYTVTDKRTAPIIFEEPSQESFSENAFSFFVVINKLENEKWELVTHLINKAAQTDFSKRKVYDSFYKILMEQKSTMQLTLNDLLNETKNEKDFEKLSVTPTYQISTDLLSGTWEGEDFINKIVIMRSGRGFVIFDNGASMNIDIQIKKSNDSSVILVTQQSKANASFFPELPRNIALNAAKDAKPIQWTLTLTDSNTLKGIKNTLVLLDNQETEYKNITVNWNRKSQISQN